MSEKSERYLSLENDFENKIIEFKNSHKFILDRIPDITFYSQHDIWEHYYDNQSLNFLVSKFISDAQKVKDNNDKILMEETINFNQKILLLELSFCVSRAILCF